MTKPGTAWDHRGSRGRRALTIATVALLSMVGTAAASPANANADGRPEDVLDRDLRGERALQALGDRLPAVAAANGMSPGEFRRELREDDTLWVGRSGRLLFVDEHHAPPGEGPESAPLAVAPLEDTFTLHSRPGADRVIHLDFDGHDATGTAWDDGGTTVAEPYSQDGDPSTFNDAERTEIQSVWRRMAEDFAPFDIDVTTEDPGAAAIDRSGPSDEQFGTRLVVTPTYVYPCSCGGVAYVGVFDATSYHSHYQPAWVFTGGVGNGAKNIAEAASHEVGHNLGLSHDGTASVGYYRGHGDWGPIMGVGYYEPITQWSRGEYAGANETEDDLAVIVANGGPLVADDHGDGVSSATVLTGPDTELSGLISTAADVDAFSFTTTGGTVTIDAQPAPTSPNLDIELTLHDDAGGIIAQSDPASSASSGNDSSLGLAAGVATALPEGSYTVEIDGVGFGDPATDGYSDYGSLGRYTLTASFPTDDTTPPPPDNEAPTAVVVAGVTSGETPLTVDLSAAGSNDPDGEIVGYSWDVDGGTPFSTTATTSRTFAAAGTYTVTATVTDDGGLTDADSVVITVTDPPPAVPAQPTGLSATAPAATVELAWTDASDNESGFEIQRERLHRNRWRSTTTFTAAADATGYDDSSVSANTWRYRIRAFNNTGSSTWTGWVEVTVASTDDGGGAGGGGKGNGGGKGKKR